MKKAQESADAYKNASQSEQQTLQNIENYLYGEKGGNNTGDNTTGGGGSTKPAGLKVGSTVSYAPTGTYNWQAQYYASTDKITYGEENVEVKDVILDSSTDDYKINTWRVLEIDKTNQKVTLVPNNTSKGVLLQGAQGYNNGVKLLNDACSKLYGTPSRGITARSIKIEDIENKLTTSALASARGDIKQVSSAYSKGNSYYPSMYAQEKLSVIDGTKRSTGLDISEQKTLIGRTDNGAAEGRLQASSIQPYHNWRGININVTPSPDDSVMESQWSSLSKFFQTDTESGINYSDLLIGHGENWYWIASRALTCDGTGAAFGLYTVGYDDAAVKIGIIGVPLIYSFIPSDIDLPTGIESLFPIVTVPANLIVPDGENFKVE